MDMYTICDIVLLLLIYHSWPMLRGRFNLWAYSLVDSLAYCPFMHACSYGTKTFARTHSAFWPFSPSGSLLGLPELQSFGLSPTSSKEEVRSNR